ncbi:MAG: serine/threonine protein kinase, partial [Myxococcales bacterium]|nr:serine/threonine protein kinase [Myxococcales bacterium]
MRAPTGPPADPLVGRVVAGHQIGERVGEGGMGVVYAARPAGADASAPARFVVKVLRPVIAADPTMVARLFNELRATEKVQHPGVVRVHSVGEAPDVGPYVVMERLEGEGLGDLMKRRGQLAVEEAVRLCCALSDVLGAAHAAGIVHRDLKPENVFVLPAGAVTPLKVLDFGMALVSDHSSPRMTKSFQTFGTPIYMSPEQCASAKQVDHRTDIYALGVIAFEMIAGRPPFDAEGTGRLLAMHQYEPPPRLDRLAMHCPQGVADAIAQALAKKPDERYASAGAFARALAHALSDARGKSPASLGVTLPPQRAPSPVRTVQQQHAAVAATLPPTAPPTAPP